MVDIATLGYAVNTAELKEGTRELDRVSTLCYHLN